MTKTVTPLCARAIRRPASPRPRAGCSTRSASRTRASTSSSRSNLPRLAALGVPLWVSVGGFSAADFALVCERLDEHDGGGDDRAQPLLSERGGGAGDRRRARHRRPLCDEQAALREALARDVGRRRVGSRGRGRGRRRPLPREHDPRARARSRHTRAQARTRSRRLLGACPAPDRPGVCPRLRRGGGPADPGHGRHRDRPGRAGLRGCRGERRRARDDPLLGPLGACPSARRACRNQPTENRSRIGQR